MRQLLKDRNARWYLGGQFFSLFGDTSMWLAMGIWVKELTHSNGEAGLSFFFFALATMASPLAGMVVDRFKRRPLLIISNLGGAGVVLALLGVQGRSQVWLIWLVSFLYGVVYSFLSSGQMALLATMLPDELLPQANGALSTVREGLRLVGPLAGAGLFALAGGGVVAIVDAATFLIAATALLFVRVPEDKPVPTEKTPWRQVSAGARHVWRVVVLRQVVLATALACLVVGFLETICFAIVSLGLHRPATFLGVLLSVQGIGAIAGGLTAAAVIKRLREGLTVGFSLAVIAAGCALDISSNLWVVFAGVVLLGAALPWLVVAVNTLIQRRTPNELLGRVSSAVDLMVSTPQTISIALGAALVTLVDYRLLLVVVAAVLVLASGYLLSRSEQRRLPEPSLAEAELVAQAGTTVEVTQP